MTIAVDLGRKATKPTTTTLDLVTDKTGIAFRALGRMQAAANYSYIYGLKHNTAIQTILKI